MVRRNLNDEDERRLDELEEAEGIDSDAQMIRVLIRDGYDDAATGGYVYDPRGERLTPLDTDEFQDILFRYDAPAINPDHVQSWPRDRKDKRRVLAAICRYEGVPAEREAVVEMIRRHLGEGDPVTVPSKQLDKDSVSRPRNIHHYANPVVGLLDEHASEEADNLPNWWHDLPDDYERVDEWSADARNVLDGGPDDEDEALRVLAMGRQIEGALPEDVEQYEWVVDLVEELAAEAEVDID